MNKKKVALILIPLLMILASGIRAFNFSEELRLNQDMSSERDTEYAQICMDHNGHIYVCWFDQRRDKLCFRHGLLQEDYQIQWDEEEKFLGDGLKYFGAPPSIVCDDSGNVYVAWVRGYEESTAWAWILFNCSNDHGTSWDFPSGKVINDSVDARRGEPSIACDNSGHVYVVWDDLRSDFYKIYSDYSHDAGHTWHEDIFIGPSNSLGIYPKIACDEEGHVFVAWTNGFYPAGGIYFSRSLDYGISWEHRGILISHSAYPIYEGPLIANNGDGKVYVAWIDARTVYRRAYLNYSHDHGATWQDEDIQVSDTGQYSSANYLVLKCDQGDHVYAGWQDWSAPYISGAYFDYSNDGGLTWHQDRKINTDLTSSGGGLLDMDADDDGFVYMVWVEQRDENLGVWMNFSTNYGIDWLANDHKVDMLYQRCLYPKMKAGQWNGYPFAGIIWWEEFSSNHYDVYASRMWYLEGGMAVAPGPGEENKPYVRMYDGEGIRFSEDYPAYQASGYGAEVAAGTLQEGFDKVVITGPGPGSRYGPNVRGYGIWGDAVPGLNFMAYGISKYGVNVGLGDIDGDGADEILTGPGPGRVFGPHVRAWRYDGEKVLPLGSGFFAYSTGKYGVNVGSADIDGDEVDEVITGPGPGPMFGAHVKCWKYEGGAFNKIAEFMAYGTGRYGVNIGGGDVDGNHQDEILTGPGPSPAYGSHVRGWRYLNGQIEDIRAINFKAYQTRGYGCKVAGGDTDWDGFAEIITMPGPGPAFPAHLRGFDFDGEEITPIAHLNFFAFDPSEYKYGGNVAVFSLEPEL